MGKIIKHLRGTAPLRNDKRKRWEKLKCLPTITGPHTIPGSMVTNLKWQLGSLQKVYAIRSAAVLLFTMRRD